MSTVEIEILDAMRRTIANAVLYSHHVAEQVGLGPSDSQFLMLLEMHGPLTPGQLAEHSGLTTGTVTGVLDRLEKLGLTKRDRDPGDRRKVIVSRVEEKVGELMGPHYAPMGEHLLKVLKGFTKAELKAISEFLRKLDPTQA